MTIILYMVLAYLVFSIMYDAGKLLMRTEQNQFKLVQIEYRLNGVLYGLAVWSVIELLTS